jgi:hypothetical protein
MVTPTDEKQHTHEKFHSTKKTNDLQISSLQKEKKETSLRKKKDSIIFKFLLHWGGKKKGEGGEHTCLTLMDV